MKTLNKTKLQAKVAVILSRVTCKAQKNGYSLDGQLSKCRDYCTEKGLQVIKEYTFYTRKNRTKFFEMIDFIKKQKEPVALICDKLERLQRSFKETPILEELRKSGKLEIHLVTEGQVLHKDSTDHELMVYNMLVMMTESYCSHLSLRIKRGIAESKLRRISEYYANGDMSKEDFDRMKSELELKLNSM